MSEITLNFQKVVPRMFKCLSRANVTDREQLEELHVCYIVLHGIGVCIFHVIVGAFCCYVHAVFFH